MEPVDWPDECSGHLPDAQLDWLTEHIRFIENIYSH
jgi:hypothetical protein